MARKADVERHYPPDYVSAESLAYRLEIARSTLDDLVKRGLFPKPITIGIGMHRWYWPDVVEFIRAQNSVAPNATVTATSTEDPFSKGTKRVCEAESAQI